MQLLWYPQFRSFMAQRNSYKKCKWLELDKTASIVLAQVPKQASFIMETKEACASDFDVDEKEERLAIEVSIIIPVHNAETTIQECVDSAMQQTIPKNLVTPFQKFELEIHVCCYNDGSTDNSWDLLCQLQQQYTTINRNETPSSGKTTDQDENCHPIPSKLLISQSPSRVGRGAGYARNRAVEMTDQHYQHQLDHICRYNERFLCWLDSDDFMHEHRVAEQVCGLMALPKNARSRTLMGCKMKRDPPDSTWHYTQWANGLTNDRLQLERFREVTVLQPTWMMSRPRFECLGGYIEAPAPTDEAVQKQPTQTQDKALNGTEHVHAAEKPRYDAPTIPKSEDRKNVIRLIHPLFDNPQTLRLAEDLRFFHAHIAANGLLRLHQPSTDPDLPLVTYRHRANQSQSYQTSRKLLLHLRALAFETAILNITKKEKDLAAENSDTIVRWEAHGGKFVVWGAGRDGKDFVKALSEKARQRVFCLVDVDMKKIQQGFYVNRELGLKIPIVHFSLLAADLKIRQQLLDELQNENQSDGFGRIDKSKSVESKPGQGIIGAREQEDQHRQLKRPKLEHKPSIVSKTEQVIPATLQVTNSVDLSLLPLLPVVVCVAMYRTNGALERNVGMVGRTEGKTLWHFS